MGLRVVGVSSNKTIRKPTPNTSCVQPDTHVVVPPTTPSCRLHCTWQTIKWGTCWLVGGRFTACCSFAGFVPSYAKIMSKYLNMQMHLKQDLLLASVSQPRFVLEHSYRRRETLLWKEKHVKNMVGRVVRGRVFLNIGFRWFGSKRRFRSVLNEVLKCVELPITSRVGWFMVKM